MPISNFFGWLLTVYIIYQFFSFYLRRREVIPSSPRHLLTAIAFYALSALGNLLVFVPSFLGSVFVDATGKRWIIHNILWVSRLVPIFLIIPLCLIAWLIISKSLDSCEAEFV